MDIKSLKESGFKEYQPARLTGCDKAFQKAITTRDGTKLYFINVQMWDFRKYHDGTIGWDAWAALYLPEEEDAWVIHHVHSIQNWHPKYLEQYYYAHYMDGEYVPDKHNND